MFHSVLVGMIWGTESAVHIGHPCECSHLLPVMPKWMNITRRFILGTGAAALWSSGTAAAVAAAADTAAAVR